MRKNAYQRAKASGVVFTISMNINSMRLYGFMMLGENLA